MGYHLSFLVNTVGVRFSSDEDGNRDARPHAPSLDSGGREIGVRCWKRQKRWAHASGSNIQEPRIKTYPVLQFSSAGSRFETEMLNWCTQRNLADSHTKTSQASARTMVTKIKGTMAVIGTHIPVSEELLKCNKQYRTAVPNVCTRRMRTSGLLKKWSMRLRWK